MKVRERKLRGGECKRKGQRKGRKGKETERQGREKESLLLENYSMMLLTIQNQTERNTEPNFRRQEEQNLLPRDMTSPIQKVVEL